MCQLFCQALDLWKSFGKKKWSYKLNKNFNFLKKKWNEAVDQKMLLQHTNKYKNGIKKNEHTCKLIESKMRSKYAILLKMWCNFDATNPIQSLITYITLCRSMSCSIHNKKSVIQHYYTYKLKYILSYSSFPRIVMKRIKSSINIPCQTVHMYRPDLFGKLLGCVFNTS